MSGRRLQHRQPYPGQQRIDVGFGEIAVFEVPEDARDDTDSAAAQPAFAALLRHHEPAENANRGCHRQQNADVEAF